MSFRQGVIKRDFIFPLQQAVINRLRGAAVDPTLPYEQLVKTSSILGLPNSSTNPGAPVPILDYGGVRKGTNPPYITVGDVPASTPDDTKGGSGEQISFQVHIWSRYNGNNEIAYIANQVLKVLTGIPMDMTSFGFNLFGFRKEHDASMFDGNFSHRVLRFRAWMEDLGTVQYQ